ncbi:hypothetical protein [Anaeromyxobacter diazotrophicus]|uniref:Vegetative protein n=1 Tax=Anaeromyxobacter diazotrophicus TaxID=2590199 RepID=A0A7I9VSL9_9BACT|nr:hypothetical protein [Anaeromyxobacter diazotrophicus]GEJ59442.1 hypothetical protein AMYX_41830 [Anaeromyxobacter diazotrophicus]
MAETAKTKKTAPAPKGGGKKSCQIEGCKRGYRAKGLCFFHYKKWRRGELEKKPGLGAPRYETCGKEACKKKVAAHGLCQEHFDAWKASRKSAKLSAAPAAEAPAAS